MPHSRGRQLGYQKHFRDGDIEYYFERRRYGATGNIRWFCWVIYSIDGIKWQYAPGDPYAKVTPNKQELKTLFEIIRECKAGGHFSGEAL